jgi:hypothetical protein
LPKSPGKEKTRRKRENKKITEIFHQRDARGCDGNIMLSIISPLTEKKKKKKEKINPFNPLLGVEEFHRCT